MSERKMNSRIQHIYSSSVKELVAKAEALVRLHPHLTLETINVDVDTEYDCSYVSLQYETPETDSEMKKRRDFEKRVAQSRREQYERLKKEFENA